MESRGNNFFFVAGLVVTVCLICCVVSGGGAPHRREGACSGPTPVLPWSWQSNFTCGTSQGAMWYDWTVECVRQDISNTFGGVEANMIVYIAYGEAREYILVKEKYCSGSDYLLRPISPWFLEDATCTGETVYILDKPCDHWQIVDPDMEYNFYVVQGTNILMRVYDTGAYENATVDFLDFTETKFTDNSFIVPPPVCYPSTK